MGCLPHSTDSAEIKAKRVKKLKNDRYDVRLHARLMLENDFPLSSTPRLQWEPRRGYHGRRFKLGPFTFAEGVSLFPAL